ncbi:hypothetical protein [Psychrobacter aestuarii]|uniref:SpaA-like prealbumin fold domain-containing protein n=1 Tax=Psychrobacter aestuarii TaxID=556327 RepID=A0ABN0VYB0_9GAMM|nr:hypothetical protein [Psychrobacter aestuarii]
MVWLPYSSLISRSATLGIRLFLGMVLLLCFGQSVWAAATCAANQRMYYLGANAPATAYKSQPLTGWTSGSIRRTYTFAEASGDKSFTIEFPLFLDKYTSYSEQPPFYGSLSGATLNAITMIHNSTQTRVNHTMDVTVNKPVAKLGYTIQDIDSARDSSNNVPYQEAVNVSSTGGKLTYDPTYHTINGSLDMVTSILRVACNGDSSNYACPIEATWGYKPANSLFSLTHSNEFSQYNGPHVLGYSDFYFCLEPAKITVSKKLSGARVHDTSGDRDQFEISVNSGSTVLGSVTTTGSGQTITNGSTNTLSLNEGTTYTITEKVVGSSLGDISNYDATYTCTNNTTGSSTVMPTSAMTYNSATKTRSFTLSNVNYGDDISCTITNSPRSVFDGGTSATPASCPAGHRMYYVGANAPSGAYRSTPLSGWSNGSTSRTYSFNDATGTKNFTISFASILDLYTQYQTPSPFYGDIPNATAGALNILHNSPAVRSNHVLNVTVDRSVSKLGYVIQDLDSFTNNGQSPYQERADVSGSAGILNFQSAYHTINSANNIVTSILGRNCETTNSCPINATWGYKTQGSTFSLVHSNAYTQYDSPHAVGYTDFYFCLAPPKVIVNKKLSGTRINDSASNRDQFAISVNNGSTVVSSFETTGSGQSITNGSSGAVSLAENTSYTITEKVVNSTNNGDIFNYNATYACTNSATGSTTVMPTSAMTYNAANKTRSFTLANVSYGDEITCTITNTPATYSFLGYVFNDNGGITASSATQYDVSATFTGNANYANGAFDSNEQGIAISGLQVSLTDCSGNLITTSSANPQTVSSTAGTLGQYSFSVLPSILNGKTKVCLIETEPSSWEYTIDTTADSREITLVAGTYEYKTQKDASGNITRNMDFGELRAQNAALVLRKSQYVHACNTALNYTSIADTNDPTTGFSTNPANNVKPGNCIAYKIDAYNRGHIDIFDIQIKDSLQTAPVTSVFHLPKPLGNPSTVYSSTNNSAVMGSNGTILSDKFALSKVATSSTTPTKATLYFNSKYGAIPTTP